MNQDEYSNDRATGYIGKHLSNYLTKRADTGLFPWEDRCSAKVCPDI